MTNSNTNSIRFEKEGQVLRPFLTVGDYEFKMTHMVLDNPESVYEFLRNVGALN